MATCIQDGCIWKISSTARSRIRTGQQNLLPAPQNLAAGSHVNFLTFTSKVDIPTVVLASKRPRVDRLTARKISMQPEAGRTGYAARPISPPVSFGCYLALKGFAPNAPLSYGALYVQYRGSEYDMSDANV
jgi:hypothetical protein